jgi:hypothetical protein
MRQLTKYCTKWAAELIGDYVSDNPPMHLIIPYASTAWCDAIAPQWSLPKLPHLAQLLGRLTPSSIDGHDAHSLSTPLEQVLARALGWSARDGCLPWAAHAAQRDGIDVGSAAWGQLTPVHWHVATDHISLLDPTALQLSTLHSQELFEAIRVLFESEGWRLAWGAPTRWYVAHESLDQLACASIERAIGGNIDLWLPTQAQAALFRRLQNEVQMLLYQHPVHGERGTLPINSIWLSGCGRAQAVPNSVVEPSIQDSLRAPYMAGSVETWCNTWETIDAHTVVQALECVQMGQPFTLTLAGQSRAHSFVPKAAHWWSRCLHPFAKITDIKGLLAAL